MDTKQETTANEALIPARTAANQICTAQFFHFSRMQEHIFEFLYFGAHLATRADQVKSIAEKALGLVDGTHNRGIEDNNDGLMFSKFKEFGRLMSENMCIRLADNFACFLSESVSVCIQKRPELLRSSETVKLDEVLRFSNFRELTSFLVDKKINELSYGGIRELEQFFIERTGIELFIDDNTRSNTIILNELRNICTHNRGIVNDLFIKRVGKLNHSYTFETGKRFHIDYDCLVRIANCMRSNALRLDCEVSTKFRTKAMRYSSWTSKDKYAIK